jgi:DNA helicase-2/ATP-dependent DNA helicase PcrA
VRVQDLDALCGMAGGARDLRSFVAELVLDPPTSAGDIAQPPHLDDDWLVLSTVHSAKGLEWQSVHVIAAYDGNFPACMGAGTSESIAEERRLFYVALTRARRGLTIYVPRRYYHRPSGRDDGHGYGKASRFLAPDVQALCAITHLADDAAAAPAPSGAGRIRVSVDELFA